MRGIAFKSAYTEIVKLGGKIHPKEPYTFTVKESESQIFAAMLEKRLFDIEHVTPEVVEKAPEKEAAPESGLITRITKPKSGKPYAHVTWQGKDLSIFDTGELAEMIESAFAKKQHVVFTYTETPNKDASKPPYRNIKNMELAALQQSER